MAKTEKGHGNGVNVKIPGEHKQSINHLPQC